MEKKQYDLTSLSETTLQQIRSLEKTLSEEKGEEVVLIAYEKDSHDESQTADRG